MEEGLRSSSAPSARPYEAPLIVVGAVRSGTTMLRLSLDHHPAISIFAEFDELTHHLSASELPSAEAYAALLETDRHARLKDLYVDARASSYVEIVQSLTRQAYGRYGGGKPVFGFSVHHHLDRLAELFPEARYVHIVRDPRDVARSCVQMGWVGTVHHGADFWLEAEQSYGRLCRLVPEERRLDVAYEDLVREPVRELDRVCRFAGQGFDPAMLRYAEDSTYEAPDAKLVQQWRKKLSLRELELVEARCGALMEARGYIRERESTPPKTFERLQLEVANRLGRARFQRARLGTPLYAQWVASRRLPVEAFRAAVQLRVNAIENAHMK